MGILCQAGNTRIINGSDGNDIISGDIPISNEEFALRYQTEGGASQIRGFKGNDYLFGGGDRDRLFGGEGDDHLFGGAGGDTLEGEAGDDLLVGGAGTDTIDGGDGVDTVRYDYFKERDVRRIDNQTGVSVALALSGHTVDDGLGGMDTLVSVEIMYLTAYSDTLALSGSLADFGFIEQVLADGGTGQRSGESDTIDLSGITGSELLVIDLAGSDSQTVMQGANSVAGITGFENVIGSSQKDAITGSSSQNSLAGGNDDDTVFGSAGNDYLDGGSEPDGGGDTLDYQNVAGDIEFGINSPGSGDADAVFTARSVGGGWTDQFTDFETLALTDAADSFTVQDGDTVDAFNAEGITVNGRGGQNIINASLINDDLDIDLNDSTFATKGGPTGLTLAGFEAAIGGSGNDTITGDATHRIAGGGGIDVLVYKNDNAVQPAVVVWGGSGADQILIDNTVEQEIPDFIPGEYPYDIFSDDDANGIAVIEVTNLTKENFGTFDLEAMKNSFDLDWSIIDVIVLNPEPQDLLRGRSLNPETGQIDVFTFEIYEVPGYNPENNDPFDTASHTFDLDEFGDPSDFGDISTEFVTVGGSEKFFVQAAWQFDSELGFALPSRVQNPTDANQTIDGAYGFFVVGAELVGASLVPNVDGSLRYTIPGGGGGGGGGPIGTAGNDNFIGSADVESFDGGEGIDTISFAQSSGGISIDLSTGVGTAGDAAGDTFINIENVIGTFFDDEIIADAKINDLDGGDGDDMIMGGDSDDTIDGGAGDDVIYGGKGKDTLTGGAGNDTIYAGNNYDIVNAGSGNDVVYGDNGRDIVDLGDGDDAYYDNGQWGGAGKDAIQGGAGNDTFYGGGAGDTFDGGTGIDTVDFSTAPGSVHVNLADGKGYEGFAVADTYSGIENIVGSASADILIGDGEANMITGGGGSDALTGGAGADVFAFSLGDGDDSITDFEDSLDLIDLTSTGLTFGDLTIGDDGNGGATVDYGAGDQITLTNAAGLVEQSDFIFAVA